MFSGVSETRALVIIYSLVNENAAGFCCVESDCLLLIHVANNNNIVFFMLSFSLFLKLFRTYFLKLRI